MSDSDNYIVHASKIAKGVDVLKNEDTLTVEGILEHSRRAKRLDKEHKFGICD